MKFLYKNAKKTIGWGLNYDSLTELKYAISIMEEYEFIRPALSIYYDVPTLLPTVIIRKCHRRYTADFLIRHRTTLEAFLVEIKPRAYAHNPKLETFRQVAENYIKVKKHDWQYKVVFDDEIMLTEEQLEDFESCRQLGTAKERKAWFECYRDSIESLLPRRMRTFLNNSQLDFILYGIQSKVNSWKTPTT